MREILKSSCPGYSFGTAFFEKAAIYADETKVYGIRLMSVLGPVDFGSVNNKGTTYLDEFSPGEKVIGFYGSYNDKEITSLGFLTHDPECIAIPEPEPEPEVIPEIEVELDVVAEV